MENNIKYLKSSFNEEIAYCYDDIRSDISIFFFGGYSSDMSGTKATALSKWCLKNKYNFIRFDYSGHGRSGGKFEEGGISKWSTEADEIFQNFKNKKNIIIGSSMGGWISLLVAKRNNETIHGLVGIASAPDFVVGEWNRLSEDQKTKIKKEGKIIINWDDYEDDYVITYKFLEDGMKNMLLKNTIPITCPIRLLHGKLDNVVSTSVSQTIIEKIESKDKDLFIIDDGDHSLSRDSDLNLLFNKIFELI
mgnify:CR=1 FL=1